MIKFNGQSISNFTAAQYADNIASVAKEYKAKILILSSSADAKYLAPKLSINMSAGYASNALGRLFGTLLSGILYTYVGSTVVDGFGACVLASCGVSLISSVVDMFLREDQANASFFGPFNRCLGGYQPLEAESEQGKIEKIDTVDSMQNAPSVQECEKSTDLPADTPTCQDMQNKV